MVGDDVRTHTLLSIFDIIMSDTDIIIFLFVKLDSLSHPDPVRARNFTPICVTHLTQADTVFPPSQYQEIPHPSERRNFPFPSVICPDMSFCYLPLPIRTLITTSLHTPFMCISSPFNSLSGLEIPHPNSMSSQCGHFNLSVLTDI